MLIDWFTVIAQIINFIILVYLLKRFLYKPILKAVEEREKRINQQLEDAAKQKEEATQEREQYEHLNQDLNQKKASLLKDAQTSAEAKRQDLFAKAKQEYNDLRNSLHDSLELEKSNLKGELKQRTQREVFNIARKVMADLSGTTLESQIVSVFLRKINELEEDELDHLHKHFQGPGILTVRTAFELNSDDQAKITEAIKKKLRQEVQVEFRTSPDEVAGIELSTGGYKIAWTIKEYLDSLEERLGIGNAVN